MVLTSVLAFVGAHVVSATRPVRTTSSLTVLESTKRLSDRISVSLGGAQVGPLALSETEVDMENNLGVFSSVGSALLGGSALLLLAGCGDVHTFSLDPGDIDSESVAVDHACFDGSTIKLVRYSSECDSMSKSLDSVVHDGVVFSAEEVRTLESPCADGPAPAVDVHFALDSHSVLFDFSQVAQSGQFPGSDFEGYMLDVALEEGNGLLLAVTVDQELSTLGLNRSRLEWDRSHIAVNFQGVRYDQESLVKLDLIFAVVAVDPDDPELR